MNKKHRHIAIFASGNGTNAEAIMKYFYYHPNIIVRALFSNNKMAKAMERAQKYGVPAYSFQREDFYNESHVLDLLQDIGVDVIILAGFLWKVPENIVTQYSNRILNIHPALLPKYGGKGMYGGHVHQAVITNQEKESGITIHQVNEVYDDGKIIFQAKVTITENDTPETLAQKIHVLEHEHYPKVIEQYISSL